MKFYSDFNSMFSAQSGAKSDMSVFNAINALPGADGFFVNAFEYVQYDVDEDKYYRSMGITASFLSDGSSHHMIEFDHIPSKGIRRCVERALADVLSKYGYSYGEKDGRYYHWGTDHENIYVSDTFANVFGKKRAEQFYPQIARKIAEKYDEYIKEIDDQKKAEAKKIALTKRQKQDDAWNPEWDADFGENKSDANKEGEDNWSMTLTDSMPTISSDSTTF